MEALLELSGRGRAHGVDAAALRFPRRIPHPRRPGARIARGQGAHPVPRQLWLAYLKACRELGARCGVSIRTLDKAPWQHSKELTTSAIEPGAPLIVEGPATAASEWRGEIASQRGPQAGSTRSGTP
jgi:hypothetical protein